MEERRYNELELRASEDSRRVEGYALVFGSESRDLGGVVEVIAPGSLDGVLDDSDVKCWLNHDPGRGVLARHRGENVPQAAAGNSLELEIDGKGLRYAFDAPNTELGNELLEGLRRGDISQSSFAFTVSEDKWERLEDGRAKRTIVKFARLFDVSPVYEPAYYGTSVQMDRRGLDDMEADEKAKKEAEEQAKKEAEQKAHEEEVKKYYDELKKIYKL